MYGELVIINGGAHPALAQEIADCLQTPLHGVEIKKFANENIYVQLRSSVRSRDVFIIQPTCVPVSDSILTLLILIDTVRRDSAGRITAVMPYFAYGRSDKKDQPRTPITARLMADLITTAGADRFLTLDLHASQIAGFFSIPGDEMTTRILLRDHFRNKDLSNSVVVAPDEGASKRARKFAELLDLPLAIIEKRRRDAHTEALTLIGDAAGMDAIIFDDEVDTAGTVCNGAALLKASGARRVFLAATHPLFSPPAIERLQSAGFDEIVVINTVPVPAEKMLPNLTVLPVGSFLAKIIGRIHEGRSVGELINE
ncbi:MAG: ribose-phosphate diphosphokinase [Chloroflexi bacterium]|nr:ribose-phosphate diphosphokinase [Chloroflexota bacterium]MBI3733512.1 ribose-phosphate diphosphokinase [Chloroflexota bacterium]